MKSINLLAVALLLFSTLSISIGECAEVKTAEVITTSSGNPKVKKETLKLDRQDDGAYRLVIPKSSISKDTIAIDIVYEGANAKAGEDGYWVTPDGCVGDFNRGEGTYASKPVMPIFGMKTPRGTFVGIVKGLKYEFIPRVVAKDGNYKIYPHFEIKNMYFAPYEDIVVDFYELGKDATYVDMAKTYRKYQLGRGEVRPLKERIKNNKYLEFAAKSLFMKVSMAAKNNKDKIEHQTRQNEPKLMVFCTFDDSMKMMKDFKSRGIDNVQICYTGWIQKGHDGRSLEIFPVEEAVGGEAKMREAVAFGKSLGYQMTCHIAYTGAFTISNCWDEEYIAKRPDGSLWAKSVWSGGRSYQPCMKRVLELFVEKDYKHIKDIGIEGIFHLDVNSAIRPPYCCDKRHPQTRQQGADAMNAIQRLSHKYFGGQGSEAGFDHVASTLDFSLYTSTYYTYRSKSPLIGGRVPLWQVVYHGIILSNPFLKTMYYMTSSQQDYEVGRLLMAEFGGRPVIYASTKKVLSNLDRIKKEYDDFQKLAHLQLEFIEDHRQIKDGVFQTTYSNADAVIVNYNKEPATCRGITIPAQDYIYLPGGKTKN